MFFILLVIFISIFSSTCSSKSSFVTVSSRVWQIIPASTHIISNKKLASYFNKVRIGEQQEFKVLFDTGSHEIWVPCHSCESTACHSRNRYDPRVHGQLLIHEGKVSSFEVNYVSGGLKGNNFLDSFSLGTTTIEKQAITCAEKVDIPVLSTLKWDGIVGLGFIPDYESSRPHAAQTVLSNILEQKTLIRQGLSNQFSIYFGRNHGSVIFGGYLQEFKRRSDEPFVYVKVIDTSKGYWGVQVHSVAIAEKAVENRMEKSKEQEDSTQKDASFWDLIVSPGTRSSPYKTLKDRKRENESSKMNNANFRKLITHRTLTGDGVSIFDSGTFFIYTPKGTLSDSNSPLSKALPSRIFSCEDIDRLPSLLFSFQGIESNVVQVILRPHDYVLRFSSSLNHSKLENNSNGSKVSLEKEMCTLGIKEDAAAHGDQLGGWTFGQVFMRAYYTVFDFENLRIGLVRGKQTIDENFDHDQAKIVFD